MHPRASVLPLSGWYETNFSDGAIHGREGTCLHLAGAAPTTTAKAAGERSRSRSRCCASAGHCDDRTRVACRSATVPIGILLSGREGIGLHPFWEAQNGI